MQLRSRLMGSLVLCAALASVSSCASKATPLQAYPPIADLRDEPKPRLTPEMGESDAALALHDIEVERWGDRGWEAVGRICRWAKANGLREPVTCRLPPPDS